MTEGPCCRSLCADVRPIIRAVFRELDLLPALGTELPTPAGDRLAQFNGTHGEQWVSLALLIIIISWDNLHMVI